MVAMVPVPVVSCELFDVMVVSLDGLTGVNKVPYTVVCLTISFLT